MDRSLKGSPKRRLEFRLLTLRVMLGLLQVSTQLGLSLFRWSNVFILLWFGFSG
jgi:hypothetical protein